MKNAKRNTAIIRARQSGLQPAEIANRLGLSKNIVAGVCFRSGQTNKASPNARGRATNLAMKEAVVRYSEKVGVIRAAKAYGFSRSTVDAWVRGL